MSEPLDVGPKVGGDREVTARDRTEAEQAIETAFAHGKFGQEERDRRMLMAQHAEIIDDLTPLTRDLNVPVSYAAAPSQELAVPEGQGTTHLVRAPEDGSRRTFVGFFGGASRRGAWTIPSKITAVAVLGGVELDLTSPHWESSVVEISAFTTMGGVELRVDDDVEVRADVVGIMGGTEINAGTTADRAKRVVILKGVAMLGGIEVKRPRKRKDRGTPPWKR